MASLPPMLPTAFADSSRGALSGTGMPPNAPADSSGGGAVSASPARGLGSPRAGKTLATEGEVDRTRKWEELTEAERSAARVLGYGPEAWDGALVPPGCCESEWERDQTEVRSWEELTTEQRQAASFLGYTASEWDAEMRGSEPPPDNGRHPKFADGEDVLAYDASGKCLPAKVLQSRRSNNAADGGEREYYVHYRGWKSKWDCWVGTAAVFKKTSENLEEVMRVAEDDSGAAGQKRKRTGASSIEERLAERRRARIDAAASPARPKRIGAASQPELRVTSSAAADSTANVAAMTSPPRNLVWDEISQSYEPAAVGPATGAEPAASVVHDSLNQTTDAGATANHAEDSSLVTRASELEAPKRQSEAPKLPPDDPWQKKYDGQRKQEYWWNPTTSTSTWVHPVTGLFPDGRRPAKPSSKPTASKKQKPKIKRSPSRLIVLPAVLDTALASELQWIADEKRQLVLPSSPSADAVLQSFVAERRKSTGTNADAAERFAKRIRAELRQALGTKLLYSAERQEYHALRQQVQKATPADADAAAGSPMDVLIGQMYGAQHLLRLLVAVPALRSVPAEDTPTAEDAAQPTPVLAPVPEAGSSPKQPQQQLQSKGPVEVEHFIRFLASHTGVSEWLGDDAAYVARGPQVEGSDSSERDTSKPPAEAMTVAAATSTRTAPTDVTVGQPRPTAQVGEGGSRKTSDWRERALSFLSAVDGDL